MQKTQVNSVVRTVAAVAVSLSVAIAASTAGASKSSTSPKSVDSGVVTTMGGIPNFGTE